MIQTDYRAIGETSQHELFETNAVTISPEFQAVIPRAIRKALHLPPGKKLRVLRCAERLEFIPVRPMQEMRGFLRGTNPTIERDDDRL